MTNINFVRFTALAPGKKIIADIERGQRNFSSIKVITFERKYYAILLSVNNKTYRNSV